MFSLHPNTQRFLRPPLLQAHICALRLSLEAFIWHFLKCRSANKGPSGLCLCLGRVFLCPFFWSRLSGGAGPAITGERCVQISALLIGPGVVPVTWGPGAVAK